MRVSASLGLVVLLASLASCEQRNFAHCIPSDPNFACEEGKFCKQNDVDKENGVGTCEDSQCTIGESPSRCTSAAAPICTTQGRCVGCTNSTQCAALGAAQPFCFIDSGKTEGTCVACNVDKDCDPTYDLAATTMSPTTLTPTPACDKSTHTCRACALHSECASGVCAKDDTLKSLSRPIALGMCAPRDRVLTLDTLQGVCPAPACSMQSTVTMATADKPYVLVKNYDRMKGGSISLAVIPSLPEQHIVGATSDLSPSALGTAKPKVELQGNGVPAINVGAGVSVTLEGIYVHDTVVAAISCNSLNTTATSIKLLRSIISTSDVGIRTSGMCSLVVDQSWIGTPPNQASPAGNSQAMTLDSTDFKIINSVFDRNISIAPNSYGGITLTDTGKPGTLQGVIVNSTFYRHEGLQTNRPALAVYCPDAPKSLTIFNTLFVNTSAFKQTNPMKPFVDPKCYSATGSALGYYATDEKPAPSAANVIADITDGIFTNAGSAMLSLLPTASPKALITGGAKTFNGIPSPTVDAEGKPRGATSVSIGAFEVAH